MDEDGEKIWKALKVYSLIFLAVLVCLIFVLGFLDISISEQKEFIKLLTIAFIFCFVTDVLL